MNLKSVTDQIDSELKKVRSFKRHAQADGNSNYDYFLGYEQGLLYAKGKVESKINKVKIDKKKEKLHATSKAEV